MFRLVYRGPDKSLARPTSRCILFDGENISFDASLVIYINSTNIPPVTIINRIYENQSSVAVACVLPDRAKDLPAPLYTTEIMHTKKKLFSCSGSLHTRTRSAANKISLPVNLFCNVSVFLRLNTHHTVYSAMHGFWPVEFSKGRLGASH
jgi:hypothetical protein